MPLLGGVGKERHESTGRRPQRASHLWAITNQPDAARSRQYASPPTRTGCPARCRTSSPLVANLRRRGVGFRTLHEALDTITPDDRLVFHAFAALAEFIRES
jgi:hypothetical protein